MPELKVTFAERRPAKRKSGIKDEFMVSSRQEWTMKKAARQIADKARAALNAELNA